MRAWTILLLYVLPAAAADPPRRIVSTAPSVTEMLYALNLGDRVVGVTTYCQYPPEVRSKPKVGTFARPDLEAVLQLRPDLVVLLQHATTLQAKLPAFGIPALELKNESFEDICQSLLTLGSRTGVESTAQQRVSALRSELQEIRARLAPLPRRRVMFVVGRTPGTIRDLIVVGRASFLNQLIEVAGGENVFGASAVAYPKISREEVLARRPEVIVDTGDASVAELWKPWLPTSRVYAVSSEIFVVPGPRVTEAARALARMIHPEAQW